MQIKCYGLETLTNRLYSHSLKQSQINAKKKLVCLIVGERSRITELLYCKLSFVLQCHIFDTA